jgi:hypothetical protein
LRDILKNWEWALTNPTGQDRRGAARQDQPRQQVSRPDAPPILEQVGPCRFGRLGAWITVQCPTEFDALMMEAGAVWESGGRRWLVSLRRLGPVLRKLRQRTDPLFRQAGVNLDGAQ